LKALNDPGEANIRDNSHERHEGDDGNQLNGGPGSRYERVAPRFNSSSVYIVLHPEGGRSVEREENEDTNLEDDDINLH